MLQDEDSYPDWWTPDHVRDLRADQLHQQANQAVVDLAARTGATVPAPAVATTDPEK